VGKYGKLREVVIPKPGKTPEEDPPGVGLVFLYYEDAIGAGRARVRITFLPLHVHSNLIVIMNAVVRVLVSSFLSSCQVALHGRTFGGQPIDASVFSKDRFEKRDFS
jgi:hypothetical protein